ncbi:hypothetical protein C8A00DRAFT_12041 [Chaetomidium leptoderma]|uniref:MAPEG family protein n=1 Tax=Chaetomidium leptoderma TaxID=669021 RepID=A0AAN6VV61_9PEZI|nr:hypothetical protein C8A00DRAFT_12041 [Chaetomidium leptoderma]
MAALIDFTSTNWSYYTIPVAFALCMIPHSYSMVLAGKNHDIGHPRKTEEHCAKDTSMDKATVRRISRAKAAASNGFETLGLYAAAVVAGNVAGVATERMNQLTLAYVVSRVAYNYVYISLQDNARFAALRPLVWLAGIAVVMMLFVAAGKALN